MDRGKCSETTCALAETEATALGIECGSPALRCRASWGLRKTGRAMGISEGHSTLLAASNTQIQLGQVMF